MAHLITKTDRVGIVGDKGWHGLGEKMPPNLSALEALEWIGLDWEIVESQSLTATLSDGSTVDCTPVKKALVRSDTKMVTGVVGPNYKTLQNRSLASIGDSLCEEDLTVSVDTLGSLAGGEKVWISLRGKDTVIGGDAAYQFLLLSNSHNGCESLRIHPTMTRVVCNNTYTGAEQDSHLGFTWRHSAGLDLRRDEIISSLAMWRSRIAVAKSDADKLAQIEVNHERCQSVWMAVYERLHGYSIPVLPNTPMETRRKERAVVALGEMAKRFDLERQTGCKPTLWLASQAATNWIQHVSGRLEENERAASSILGSKASQTSMAMSVVTASV